MNELACTFDEFKQRIKFAIDQHRTGMLKPEEFDQLVKMVHLGFTNLSDGDKPTIRHQSVIALQLFHREVGLEQPLPGIPASRFWERFHEISAQRAKTSAGPNF